MPFFSISGSEFIQMFVGVGASRVRDMFATAKENSPSILFIDEIDAVGRHRGAGLGGGHDEREQTLNQILSEMDGFTQSESVIVMAATNRPDILDPALLRPGRFDRHVTVDRPNLKGRLAIFKVHCRGVPLADDVELDRVAAGTVGLTGADIRNLVNEAALWATREDKDHVQMADFEYARDKVLMGSKREEVLSGKEKWMTAYHEAGHALSVWLVPSSDRVHKVSIIPRGRSLGATQILPEEDRVNISESELHSRLAFLLAGRAAEKLEFDEFSAGAEDDLKRATQIARRMVSHWGMSERLGPVAFRAGEEHPFLGKEMSEPREFSEHTACVIDEEIMRVLRDAADAAACILRQHQGKLRTLAEALEREETLDERQIEELIGPAAWRSAGPASVRRRPARRPTIASDATRRLILRGQLGTRLSQRPRAGRCARTASAIHDAFLQFPDPCAAQDFSGRTRPLGRLRDGLLVNAAHSPGTKTRSPPSSAFLVIVLSASSILKGSAFILTRMVYESDSSEGTRHEYEQVKPHPYSKLPRSMTSPLALAIVNEGFSLGRVPRICMSEHTSPVDPTTDRERLAWSFERYCTRTVGL